MNNTSGHHVVVIDAHYPNYETEQEILESFQVKLEHIDSGKNPEKVWEEVQYADAVLVREYSISSELINVMKKCKVIVRYGVGVDNVDLVAAKIRGIFVANVPDYGSEEVADQALALLLATARRIVPRDRDVRQGGWNIGPKEPMHSFNHQTLGIIGFGRIGKTFYRKASGLGYSRFLIHDPFVTEDMEGLERVDLNTLCQESDAISLHAPLTKENYHIINDEKLSLMKQNAIIINTSRGGLIDENALVKALQEKTIFGAGLDVFENEPPDRNHPLMKMGNVIVSDHTGWYSEDSLKDLQKKAAQEVARVFTGNPPKSWVNRWEG